MVVRVKHQRFDGYKLSASVTNTAEPLITAIAVAPASEQDGPQAAPLIDGLPEHRRPRRVLGDTAYGTGPVRAQLAERDIDVLAPVPPGAALEGRLAKRDFDIDLDADTVTCPAGQVARIRTEPSGQRRAQFSKRVCKGCPLRERCTTKRGDRTILIAPDEELLIAARHALENPDTAEHLRRTRPRIERLLGLLAHRYGSRKSRYIGLAKARLQAAWAAALVKSQPDRPPPDRPDRLNGNANPDSPAPSPPRPAPPDASRSERRATKPHFFRGLLVSRTVNSL